MFKYIRCLAPHYLSNDVTMVVDIHGYNTRSSENMDLYVPSCTKALCKRSFFYKGSMLWTDLPDILNESNSLDVFKSNYHFIIGWHLSLSIYGYICLSIYTFQSFTHFHNVPTFYWGTYVYLNTLRPRQNGRRFADDTFKCIFLNENARISIEISLKFVPKGPINNIPSLV